MDSKKQNPVAAKAETANALTPEQLESITGGTDDQKAWYECSKCGYIFSRLCYLGSTVACPQCDGTAYHRPRPSGM